MIALDRLQQIIPADVALANKSLATALQQISGIQNLSSPELATITGAIETTKNLPLISAQTQAVPDNVANFYASNVALGGGVNGTIRIVDIIGLAAGWIATEVFTETVEIFSTMNMTNLIQVYQTMNNVMSGTYGSPTLGPITIPPGLPGAGDYYALTGGSPISAADNAMTGLSGDSPSTGPGVISAIGPAISSLASIYPEQTARLNVLWTSLAEQISRENLLQPQAQLDFSSLTSNDTGSIYGFIFSLPSYGLDIQVGGMAQFIELISDITTQGGQAVIGCLREGRNQAVLNNAGINTNSNIPMDPNPPPPQATLLPSN